LVVHVDLGSIEISRERVCDVRDDDRHAIAILHERRHHVVNFAKTFLIRPHVLTLTNRPTTAMLFGHPPVLMALTGKDGLLSAVPAIPGDRSCFGCRDLLSFIALTDCAS